MSLTLYGYRYSSTSFRVRAALNLKRVAYREVCVDLAAGAQHEAAFRAVNPSGGVPALRLPDGTVLTQSLAILDYLDAAYPTPALLPADPVARAQVQARAQIVACDIHPVNNRRVVEALAARFGAEADAKADWMHHWMAEGFDALQAMLPPGKAARIAVDGPDLADLCITAQVFNARRFALDLAPYPSVAAIETACLDIPAIAAAHPAQQPEAAPT
jgi:maleylacetoacetate isomerase